MGPCPVSGGIGWLNHIPGVLFPAVLRSGWEQSPGGLVLGLQPTAGAALG